MEFLIVAIWSVGQRIGIWILTIDIIIIILVKWIY